LPGRAAVALRLLQRDGRSAVSVQADPICLVETRLQELGTRLVGMVGAEGYVALIDRSLHLAAIDFPALLSVGAMREQPGQLKGLQEALRALPARDVRGALVAILAGVIELLAIFVGLELTVHLMGEVWPWLDELERVPRAQAEASEG
jgi:hypothetical protein